MLIDVQSALIPNGAGEHVARYTQTIPDEFLDHLKDERFDSVGTRTGAMHRVCSVPVAIVEKWLHEGFDIYKEPVTAVLARLRKESLDAFITTAKRI